MGNIWNIMNEHFNCLNSTYEKCGDEVKISKIREIIYDWIMNKFPHIFNAGTFFNTNFWKIFKSLHSNKKKNDDTEGRTRGKWMEIDTLNMNLSEIFVKLYQNQKIYLFHLEWMQNLLNAIKTGDCILGS